MTRYDTLTMTLHGLVDPYYERSWQGHCTPVYRYLRLDTLPTCSITEVKDSITYINGGCPLRYDKIGWVSQPTTPSSVVTLGR